MFFETLSYRFICALLQVLLQFWGRVQDRKSLLWCFRCRQNHSRLWEPGEQTGAYPDPTESSKIEQGCSFLFIYLPTLSSIAYPRIDVGSVCFTSLYSKLCFGKFWPRVGIAKHPTPKALGQDPNLFRKSEMGGPLIHIVKDNKCRKSFEFEKFTWWNFRLLSHSLWLWQGKCVFFLFFVFLFLVFVFIAFQKVHMLTNSGYCPRLVVAAVGSLLLATAPTWSIASTPQCNEWNKTRCSDDDDDYDHLNIFKTISLSIRSRSNPTHELE